MDIKYEHKVGTKCKCGADISHRHQSTKHCLDCGIRSDHKRARDHYWKNK